MLAPKTRPRRLQDGSQDEVRDIFRSSADFGRFGAGFIDLLVGVLIDIWSIFDV